MPLIQSITKHIKNKLSHIWNPIPNSGKNKVQANSYSPQPKNIHHSSLRIHHYNGVPMRSQKRVRSTSPFIIHHYALCIRRRRKVGLSTLMGLCHSYSAKAYLSSPSGQACVYLSSISHVIYAPYRYHPSRKKC